MRSLITRLALVGIVGVAIAGCGTTSGSSLPQGGAEGNGGGGVVPVSAQTPTAGTVAGLLVDGGTKAYTGFNTTAVDTLDAATPASPTDTKGKTAPADVAGSHSIVYSGNGLTQQIFKYSGSPVNLTYTSSLPGSIMPYTYGAIVFFATPAASSSSLSIELTGGSGTTAFDVRVACTGTSTSTASPPPVPPPARYVCPLPAYGAASTANIINPVFSASASGTFTPTAATLYLVANDASPLATTSTTNTILLDYLYAEQGTV